MTDAFDPYHRWLGIPPQEQPPNHYRLLGLQCLEQDADVIETAADQRAAGLRLHLDGRHAAEARALLKEIAAAKVCLLLPERKHDYDQRLSHQLEAQSSSDVGSQLGEYLLEEKLGEGGMGVVYRARHLKLGRMVALKILAKGRVADPQAIARFEREIAAIGRIEHPNIVQALDARELGGTRFLVMEYIEGLHLGEILRRCGRLSIADASHLACQTAQGLQAAHERGLVHRDIKPSNVMLMANGVVKVLDLGLVRFSSAADATAEEVTASGQAMGTIDYMAPEQVADSRHVDIRADIYSLGCTYYKLLSGKAPFAGSDFAGTLDKLLSRVQRDPRPIEEIRGDIPPRLSALLRRMLAREPADRFATPLEVALALQPWTQGSDLPCLLTQALRVDPDRLPPEVPMPSPPVVARSASTAVRGGPWKVWLKTAVAASLLLMVFGLTAPYLMGPSRKASTAPGAKAGGRAPRVPAPGAPSAPEPVVLSRPEPKLAVETTLPPTPKPEPRPSPRPTPTVDAEGPARPPLAKLSETIAPPAKTEPSPVEPPKSPGVSARPSAVEPDRASIERALAEDRYEEALELASAAYRAVSAASNKEVRKTAMDRRNQVQRLAERWKEYQAARATLDRSPGDAEAQLTAGRWLSFVRGDWHKGLAHLAQGSDAGLGHVARREQKPPQDAAGQAELGDAWWEAGQSHADEDRDAMLRRALHWYRRAEPAVEAGLVKIKIQKRFDEASHLGISVPTDPN